MKTHDLSFLLLKRYRLSNAVGCTSSTSFPSGGIARGFKPEKRYEKAPSCNECACRPVDGVRECGRPEPASLSAAAGVQLDGHLLRRERRLQLGPREERGYRARLERV